MPSSPSARKTDEAKTTAKPKPKGADQAAPQRAPASPEAVQRALADPLGAAPGEILALQQTVGNRAVNRLVASAADPDEAPGEGDFRVQFKLTVGPAGDAYEQEADAVAERVLRMPAPLQRAPEAEEEEEVQRTPVVQRAPEADEEEEDESVVRRLFALQREPAGDDGGSGNGNGGGDGGGAGNGKGKGRPAANNPILQREDAPRPADPGAGFEVGGSVERELTVGKSGGKPLPESTRSYMEPRFGADFSSVRVHTGGSSDQLNRDLSAQAFTHGSDIYFGSGKYNPGTTHGNRLLAHELTHVVQQGGAVQAQREPARRKVQPAAKRTGPEAIQRALTAESTRAFDTAVKANPNYDHGKKITDKYATPVKEPTGYGAWQTEVAAQLADDNLTAEEQNKINNVGRTHGKKFWKKSTEQEQKLKDFARAYMLWDFASRTNQLRPEASAKYGSLEAGAKLAKRRGYMKHAAPFQEKFKGLIARGPTAPETQAFLQQEGFLAEMGITADQAKKTQELGPRIDVRSTFIGGPILGIHLRSHLFIVYTGRDGKQFYIRGGPGEDMDPNDPTEDGYVTIDYGEYGAATIDYDPSAPSVTVMKGDKAEAKLDAMIEAAAAFNAMKVPYRAQVEGKLAQKFKEDSKARLAMGIFGGKGENCNRAAYSVLTRAGVPTRRPVGKHPGWGELLGADTGAGKKNALRKPEKDDPTAARPITLNADRDVLDGEGKVHVYHDRMFFQEAAKLNAGTEVEELSDQALFRKIRYDDGKIGYIQKKQKDQTRTARARIKAVLVDKGLYTEKTLDEITDEIEKNNWGRAFPILEAAGFDRDYDSLKIVNNTLISLYNDFRKPASQRFKKQLDELSDIQVQRLENDPDELQAFIADVGIGFQEAMKMVFARLDHIAAKDAIAKAATERAGDGAPQVYNYWRNHLPDYEDLWEIKSESKASMLLVEEVVDSMRPEKNRGEFLESFLDDLDDIDIFDGIVKGEASALEGVKQAAEKIGTTEDFVVKRVQDYMDNNPTRMKKLRKAKEPEKKPEGGPGLPHYGYKGMSPPKPEEAKVVGTLPASYKAGLKVSSTQGIWTELYINVSNDIQYYWVKTDDYNKFLNPPPEVQTGYKTSDYPKGKHELKLTEAVTVTVFTSFNGNEQTEMILDPKNGRIFALVSDSDTTTTGRCNLQHNGKFGYIDLAAIFGPPKSAPKEPEPKMEDIDDLIEELGKEVAKPEPEKGGILNASEDNPIILKDTRGDDDLETYTSPQRVEILDDRWPDGVGEYELVFVKVNGTKFGAIYADKLKAVYKESSGPPSGGGEDLLDVLDLVEEGEAMVQQAEVIPKGGYSTEDWPAGQYDWPWDKPVTLTVAATSDGPLDITQEFVPGHKFNKITISDKHTVELGRAILWYRGGMFFISLDDLRAEGEVSGEDLEEHELGKEVSGEVGDSEIEDLIKELAEENEQGKGEVSAPVEDESHDEEAVTKHYLKVLELFKTEGYYGLDALLQNKFWLGQSLDFALHKDSRQREERAQVLADTLEEHGFGKDQFLETYGNIKGKPKWEED